MTHKTQQITIETHSVTIIRTRGRAAANLVGCRYCQTKTAVFAQIQATLIFRVAAPEIGRLLQTDQIHFADDSAICGKSLADFFKQEIQYVED